MVGDQKSQRTSGTLMTREDLLQDGTEPKGGGRLPSAAVWREGPDYFTAVFVGANVADADQLLAYGLRDLNGRTLRLVLPPAAAETARHRAVLVDAAVKVFADGEDELQPLYGNPFDS